LNNGEFIIGQKVISAIYEYNVLTETDDTHILMLDRRILCQLCKIYEQRARAGVFHLIFPEAFLLLLLEIHVQVNFNKCKMQCEG